MTVHVRPRKINSQFEIYPTNMILPYCTLRKPHANGVACELFRYFALPFLVLLLSPSVADGQEIESFMKLGGTTYDNSYDVAIGADGMIYLCGSFSSTVDFDPGPDSAIFSSPPFMLGEAFIASYDSSLQLRWVHHADSSDDLSYYSSMVLEDTTWLYTIIIVEDTVDLARDTALYMLGPPAGGQSGIICRYSAQTGDLDTAVQMLGMFPSNILLGKNGVKYVTGTFDGTVDADPGPGTWMLSSYLSNDNFFICKFDSAMNLIWAIDQELNGRSDIISACLDLSENIIITGSCENDIDLDPSSDTLLLSATQDGYLASFDSSGQFNWGFLFSPSSTTTGNSVMTDSVSAIYVAGEYHGSGMDMDPSPGVYLLPTTGNATGFLAKYDSSGVLIWAIGITGSGEDAARDIAFDDSMQVVVTGYFGGLLELDPGPASYILDAAGAFYDPYMAVYDQNTGNLVYGCNWGGNLSDYGNAVATHGEKILVTGIFQNTADFQPGPSEWLSTSNGSHDIFLIGYGDCIPPDPSALAAAVDSTVCLSDSVYLFSTASAGSGQWHWYRTLCGSSFQGTGDTLARVIISSGTYWMRAEALCYDAPICESVTISMIPSYSYTSYLPLCTGDSVLLYGTYYDSAGTYSMTYPTILGCDSTYSTIVDLIEIDTAISLSGGTLSLIGFGSSYQWLDCSTFAAIPGATSSDFTPSIPGSYALAVTYSGCVDTSGCHTVLAVSEEVNSLKQQILLAPNPSFYGKVTLTGRNMAGPAIVSLINQYGQLISSFDWNTEASLDIDTHNLSSGVYLVSISHGLNTKTLKLSVIN